MATDGHVGLQSRGSTSELLRDLRADWGNAAKKNSVRLLSEVGGREIFRSQAEEKKKNTLRETEGRVVTFRGEGCY